MPDFYIVFIKYFWFIAVAFGLINFLNLRNRVLVAVEKNPALQANAANIIAGCLFFLTVPYLALGILQTLGGYETALFFYYEPLTDPLVLLALAVPLLCVVALSAWIWLRDGAQKMVAYGLSNSGERQLKILFALAPLLLVAAFLWGRTFLAGVALGGQP